MSNAGLKFAGGEVLVSDDYQTIVNADRLVLPGVGAFKDGMEGLEKRGFVDAVSSFSEKGRPLLGICLGMQMLMDRSCEFGTHQGLSLIAGEVVEIPAGKKENGTISRKIPHIGWCSLKKNKQKAEWDTFLLDGIPENEFFYFVHSFMASPANNNHLVGYCEYEGEDVTAVIQKDLIMGTQFHPEKSGAAGLRILENFLGL